jgi:TfoX/Sxy family transcriptional regulator of competence genes
VAESRSHKLELAAFHSLLKLTIIPMANDQEFLDYIMEQLKDLEGVRYRKMFGGATLYYKDKVLALICDNQLFLKQTEAGKALLKDIVLAPAYEGSKDFFLISDELDESHRLCELIRESAKELPAPKKKKVK